MVRHGDRRAGLYLTELGWGSQDDPPRSPSRSGCAGQARELRDAYGYLLGNREPPQPAAGGLVQLEGRAGQLQPSATRSGLFRAGPEFRPKPAWHAFVAATR